MGTKTTESGRPTNAKEENISKNHSDGDSNGTSNKRGIDGNIKTFKEGVNLPRQGSPNMNNVLPAEILEQIFDFLPPTDRKAVILVCRWWAEVDSLSISYIKES